MDDLVRRLRKWGARWPEEHATAALLAEAAAELERLALERDIVRAEFKGYREADEKRPRMGP